MEGIYLQHRAAIVKMRQKFLSCSFLCAQLEDSLSSTSIGFFKEVWEAKKRRKGLLITKKPCISLAAFPCRGPALLHAFCPCGLFNVLSECRCAEAVAAAAAVAPPGGRA